MTSATKIDLPQGQDAYQRIVRDIRTGALNPGDRLTETELASRLQISRTPVREAIRQLEADGLVAHVPRLGATIRTLDPAEISELYEMRAVLEGTAARLAVRAASEVELREIADIHAAMGRLLQDGGALSKHNQHFHVAILNAARNRFLLKAVDTVQKTLLILGRSTMEQGDRATTALAEHAEILDALQNRDGPAAERLMRAHIQSAHAARLRQIRCAGPAGSGADDR